MNNSSKLFNLPVFMGENKTIVWNIFLNESSSVFDRLTVDAENIS